ncbi:MAG TPA: hypothetical protein VK856_09770 [Anaerolineaceae bacterium]|nr:hypothetical protein [Anaerolineaceae bacterium]
MSEAGSAIEALTAADIVVNNGLAAMSFLVDPMRMVATLRK